MRTFPSTNVAKQKHLPHILICGLIFRVIATLAITVNPFFLQMGWCVKHGLLFKRTTTQTGSHLLPSLIISASLHVLSLAPIQWRSDVNQQAKNTSTWVWGNDCISSQTWEWPSNASFVENQSAQSKTYLLDWKFSNYVHNISIISSIDSTITFSLGERILCSFATTCSTCRHWDPVSWLITWELISGFTEKAQAATA